MKRTLGSIICILLVMVMLVACTGTGATTTTSSTEGTTAGTTSTESTTIESEQESKEPVVITYINNSGAGENFEDLVFAEYMALNEHVTVEFQKAGSEYISVLKTKLNSGEIPDMFIHMGYRDCAIYEDFIFDMTQDPELKALADQRMESAKAISDYNGKILGISAAMQGYGYIYNKDLFAEAGITELPRTLEEMEEACRLLEEAGITPFINQYKEWWVYKHVFSPFMSAQTDDYEELARKITDGELSFATLTYIDEAFQWLDITNKYSQSKPLEADYAVGISMFAAGEGAMLNQGSWAENAILDANPDMNIGFIAPPIDNNPDKAKLMLDYAGVRCIAKDTANFEETKKLFIFYVEHLRDNGAGTQIFPIKGSVQPDSQLVDDMIRYEQEGRAYNWAQTYWPDGFEQQLGALFQEYTAGSKDKDQVIEELQNVWMRATR